MGLGGQLVSGFGWANGFGFFLPPLPIGYENSLVTSPMWWHGSEISPTWSPLSLSLSLKRFNQPRDPKPTFFFIYLFIFLINDMWGLTIVLAGRVTQVSIWLKTKYMGLNATYSKVQGM